MLMIRFQRIGRKGDAAFRMVVTEKTAGPKAGKFVDLVGTYNPKTKAMTVDAERISSWVKNGAQLSPSLKNLLINKGIIEGKKINVLPKKSPIKKEEDEKKKEEPSANEATEVKDEKEAPKATESPEKETATVTA
ncbi:MAG TPA: 30S ribosomal protein S16 [Candidatus Kaiserbacteria bacterium]|nr:30S ribosomal protein S16 [Candidatus Kaiserbacteria bacterium]